LGLCVCRGGDGAAGESLACFVACPYEANLMTARTTSTTVQFRRPFILDGFERIQEPGLYPVDTHEEQIEPLSFSVWHRTSTVMRLPRAGAMEHVAVDPDQLRDALMRDETQADTSAAPVKSRPNAARSLQFRR